MNRRAVEHPEPLTPTMRARVAEIAGTHVDCGPYHSPLARMAITERECFAGYANIRQRQRAAGTVPGASGFIEVSLRARADCLAESCAP